MPTPVTIQVKLESRQAEVAVAELNKKVSAAFTAMRESVGKLNAQMKALAFDPAGILRGTDQVTRSMESVQAATRGAASGMEKLEGVAVQSGDALGTLGKEAAGAGGKLTRLAGTSTATSAALADMATGADAADTALLSLDEGSAAAGKSVAGMGRAAASALPKLDALNGTAFDPAGVVAGADEAVLSLDRVKMAAVQAKAALRGGVFFGGAGGRRGAGRGLAAEEEAGGLRAGAGAAMDLAGGGAALVTILAAVTGKLSAGFDNMLQGVKGNTTMTDADGQRMRRTTLGLMRTGTKDEEIASAYGHVENMNYTGRDADAIVTQANKMGIATHTNAEDTGQVLARLLREYNQPASRVKAVAETAHLTSAGGDMYLKEFDKYAGKAYATGANSKVNMPEVSAMLRAMTQHGLDIAKASTQAVGMISQMRNPTPQAFKYAKSLGLGDYFGSKGLEKYQPSGILAAVEQKTGGDPQKISNIFKARMGGLGAGILTGMGKNTYDDALNNKRTGTKAAFAGKTNAIDPLFNAQMKQTQQQFAALGGEIKSDFIPIGERLGPVFAAAIPLIRAAANAVKFLLDGFTRLPKPIQEAVLGLGALKLISSFLPMLGGFALVSERTTAVLGGLGKMLLEVANPFRALGGLLGGAGRAIGLLASGFLRLGPVASIVRLVFSPFALILARLAPLFGPVEVALAGVGGVLARFAPLLGPILPILGAALPVALLAAAAGAAAFGIAYAANMDGVRAKTAEVGAKVVAFINSQFGYVKRWFTANMPLIRETVKTVLAAIQEFWHAHGQRIMAILNPLWSLIKTVFSAALHIIGAVVKLAMDVINGHWSAAAKDIGVIVTNLWAVVKSLFVNGGKAIGNALMLVIDVVLDFGKRLFDGMLNAGQQAINGIVGGIKGGISKVADAAKGLALSIPQAVATHLDIHSPSRVMQKLGLNTAEGLAQGIRDGRVSVEQASRMLANTPAAIVRNAIADAKRGRSSAKKREREVHSAGEFAETVGESPEAKELHKLGELRAKGLISAQAYSEAYRQIKSKSNQASEKEASRHVEALRQIEDGLKAFQKSPETPSLDKQEAVARAEYRRQVKNLTEGSAQPYTAVQQRGVKDAASLLADKLDAIQQQRDAAKQREKDKQQREAQQSQNEADAATKQAQATTVQLNREMWQHAGGDMQAYFASLVTEADDALKAVQGKYGPASTHPNAPVVQAATDQHTAQLAVIAQQQTDAVNSLADARQQHDLDQSKISLAQYVDYLTKRRDAYAQYSQDWLDIDSKIYSADEEMQRKQLQSIEDLFQAHKISLDNYKKMLSDLAAQVPAASSVHQDVVSAANGAENKASRGEMVGGQDFWDGLAGSAAENGSKVLTALLHPKDKKSIFKSMWTDLMGSLESGMTGGLSKIIKNMLTGEGGGGFSLGGMLGGLFGHGKKAAASPAAANTQTSFGGLIPTTQFLGGGAGKGLSGNLLNAAPLLSLLGGPKGAGTITGINGPVSGGTGAGAMDIASLATSFIPGGGLLASLLKGGGLTSLFTGGLFGGGLKKLFHFSGGGVVPGTGNHDSVHAMLTPEEMVLPKAISKTLMQQAAMPQARFTPAVAGVSPAGTTTTGRGQTSGSHAEINYFGDNHYHYEEDTARSHRKLAKTLEDLVRGGTPA